MAWYRAGTATVTNGSAAIVGAGTDFVSNAQIGQAFLGPDGRAYEVTAVVSATQITLATAYLGASAAGQGYAILPTSSFARDLALGAAQLLNSFAAVRDGIGQGLFPDGSAAAPGLRFAADQDTGLRRPGDNILALTTGGADRVTINAGGKVGIGTSAPNGKLSVSNLGAEGIEYFPGNVAGLNITQHFNQANGTYCASLTYAGFHTWSIGTAEAVRIDTGGNVGIGTTTPVAPGGHTGNLTLNGAAATGLIFSTNSSQKWLLLTGDRFRITDGSGNDQINVDSSGNLLVGATSANNHTIYKNVGPNAGNAILSIYGGGGAISQFYAVSAVGYSGANAALKVPTDANTNRSINAGGTINASGADYAEYMTKAAGCGPIAKGDVCGVDRDGRLTTAWADAISFVVKSTDPAYVGGDSWSAHLPPRPDQPASTPIEPVAPEQADEESGDDFAARQAEYDEAAAAYPSLKADHDAAVAAYNVAVAAWDAELEAARAIVDRIAFAGQVPVTVAGSFAPGDYLIAAQEGVGIGAMAVAEADITFDQYRRRLGRVWAVRDGRAWVDVQHG